VVHGVVGGAMGVLQCPYNRLIVLTTPLAPVARADSSMLLSVYVCRIGRHATFISVVGGFHFEDEYLFCAFLVLYLKVLF